MIWCPFRSPPVLKFQEFVTKSQEFVALLRAEIFKERWQRLSLHCSLHWCADTFDKGLSGGKKNLCFVAFADFCGINISHDQFQATHLMSLNPELGRNMPTKLSLVGVSQLQHTSGSDVYFVFIFIF